MRYSYLSLAIALLLLPELARAQSPDSFLGGWNWVSTEYSDGRVETPGTLGYSQQYYFGENGECTVYHDMAPVQQGLWYVGEVIVGPCMIEHLSMLDGETPWYWSLACGDPVCLVLTDGLDAQPCGVDVAETKRLTLTYFGTVPSDGVGWGAVKARYR